VCPVRANTQQSAPADKEMTMFIELPRQALREEHAAIDEGRHEECEDTYLIDRLTEIEEDLRLEPLDGARLSPIGEFL